jgi:hypothetical protein
MNESRKWHDFTLSSLPHAAEELRHPPPVVEAQNDRTRTASEERSGGYIWQHIYAADM